MRYIQERNQETSVHNNIKKTVVTDKRAKSTAIKVLQI